MRLIRSFEEEFEDRELTVDEYKEAIGHAQASLEEYARLGELDSARGAYDTREKLLLALAKRLKKDENEDEVA